MATWAPKYGAPLSKNEQIILNRLMKGPCTIDEMVDAVYGDRPDGGPLYARRNVFVYLTRIRDKTGLAINGEMVYRL